MLLKLKKIKNKILIIVFLCLSLFFLSSNKLDEKKTWKSIVKEYFNFSKQNSLTLLNDNSGDTRNKFFNSIHYKNKSRLYERALSENPKDKDYQKIFNKFEQLIKSNLKYKNFKDKFVSFFDERNNIEVFEFQYINNFNERWINPYFKKEINRLINILDKSCEHLEKDTFGAKKEFMKEKFKSFLNSPFINSLKWLKLQNKYNEILKKLKEKNITLTYSILFEEKNGKKIPVLLKNFYFNNYIEEEVIVVEHNIHFGVYKVLDKLKLSWMFGNVFTQHLFNQGNITPTKRQKFLKYIEYFEKVFDEFEAQYKDRLDYYNKKKKRIINYYKENESLVKKWLKILKELITYKDRQTLINKINETIRLFPKKQKELLYSFGYKNPIDIYTRIEENKKIEKLWKKIKELIENKEKKFFDFLNQNANTWLPTNNIKFERSRKSKSLIYDRSGSIWIEKTTEIYKQRITFSYNGFYFKAEKEKTYYKTPKNKTLTTERIVLLSIYSYINRKKIKLKNINIGRVFFKNIKGKKHFRIILTQEFIDTYLSDGGYQTWEKKEQSFKEQEEDKYQKIKIKLQNIIFEYQNILKKDKLNKKKDLDRLLEIFDHVYQDLYFSLQTLKRKFKDFKNNKTKIFLNYLQDKNGWSLNDINNHKSNNEKFYFLKDKLYNLNVWKNKTITLWSYKVIDLNGVKYIIDIYKKLPNNIINILKDKLALKNDQTLSSITLLKFKLSYDDLNLMIELESFPTTKIKVSGFSIVEKRLVDHSKILTNNIINILKSKNGQTLSSITLSGFKLSNDGLNLMIELENLPETKIKVNGFSIVENRLVDHSKPLQNNILDILKAKITSKNGCSLNSISIPGFKLSNDNFNLMIELKGFPLTKKKVSGFSIVENILVDHSKPLPIKLITIIIKKYIKNKNVVILSYINEQSIFVFSKDSKNKNLQVKLKNYNNTLKTIENYKVIKIQDNEYIINIKQKLTDNILKLIKSILISFNGSVFNEKINKLNNFKFYQGVGDKLKVNLTFQGTNHKVDILYYKVIKINSKKYIVNTKKTIFGQLLKDIKKDIKNKLKEFLTKKETLTLNDLNTYEKLAFDSKDRRLTVKLKNEKNQKPIKIIGYKVNNGTIKQINVNNKETLKEEGELLLNEKQKGLGQNSLKIDDLNKNDINLKFQATDGYLSLEYNKIKTEIDKSKYKVICCDIVVKIDEKLDGAALKKLNELLEKNHGKVFSKITLNDFILKNEESQIKVKLKIQTDDRFFVKIDDYVVYKSFLKNKNKQLPENIKEKIKNNEKENSKNNGKKNNKLIIILVSSLFGAPVVIFILFKIFQLF